MTKSAAAIFLMIVYVAGNAPAYAAECAVPTIATTGTLVCLAEEQKKANLAEARKLGRNWKTKYDKFVRQCVKRIGGADAEVGDIGGASRLDLAECVHDKIKVALR